MVESFVASNKGVTDPLFYIYTQKSVDFNRQIRELEVQPKTIIGLSNLLFRHGTQLQCFQITNKPHPFLLIFHHLWSQTIMHQYKWQNI